MPDDTQDERERSAAISIGSLLAKMRWEKATPAQRAKQGRLLAAGRRRKAKGGAK